MKLTHIDLFSGIGGFSLAAQWAGFETIVFCENDEYCQKVLQKRFGGYVADPRCIGQKRAGKQTEGIEKYNGIPIIPDIRDFDGTKWRGATLLAGGFPCQPFSLAGKRKGKEDNRHLWPEMFRVIEEAKPRWVIAENVRGIINMELGQVLSDLEAIGYDFPRDLQGTPIVPVIPASGVNAPHRRDRVWIIAYTDTTKNAINSGNGRRDHGDTRGGECTLQAERSNSDDPNSEGPKLNGEMSARNRGDGLTNDNRDDSNPNEKHGDNGGYGTGENGGEFNSPAKVQRSIWQIPWIEIAARFCVLDDGLPPWVYRHRTRRLKALGNAIVPQVAFQVIKGIAEIEKSQKEEVS